MIAPKCRFQINGPIRILEKECLWFFSLKNQFLKIDSLISVWLKIFSYTIENKKSSCQSQTKIRIRLIIQKDRQNLKIYRVYFYMNHGKAVKDSTKTH